MSLTYTWQSQKTAFSLVSALTFHYLCTLNLTE